MGVSFIHINDKFQEDLKSLSAISHIAKDKGLRDNDNFWEQLILSYIITLYDDMTLKEKVFLQDKNERIIKEFIRKKLNFNKSFLEEHLLTVELEPQNQHSKILGFYDIKIRSSIWNSYFSFECKCINHTNNSILEYVYNPNKTKDRIKFNDGGIYRFLINKYSTDKKFGGMIGFLQDGNLYNVKNLIFKQIQSLKLLNNTQFFGSLTNEGIIESEVSYYFQSIHSRFDISERRICEPIKIHHLLYDFTK